MDKEIFDRIDSLLREYKLDEAEEYMNSVLSQAEEQGDNDMAVSVLNELAGFYRDKGDFERSMDCALRSAKLLENSDKTDPAYFAAMLNLANAYRAGGKLSEAKAVYDDIDKGITEYAPGLFSSFCNNIALMYQQTGEFDKAAGYLEKAIEAESGKDERKTAISRANLAVCRVRMGQDGEENARLALDYFKGMSPSDFHYSAALSAMGDVLFSKGLYEKAAQHYETALSEILIHMGRCSFYDIVSENLERCYEHFQRPAYTGMELSRKYFELIGKPVLRRNFGDELKYLACGLVGEGSECFGYDDRYSRDHDFGPSFCIFVSDDAPDELFERLRKAYSLLPPTFMGYTHTEGKNSSGRRGVIRVSDFYKRILGQIPETAEDFQLIPDEQLACAVNGEVYFDYCGEFSGIRKRISDRPYADRLAKLSAEIESISKHGEYNLPRMTERGDKVSAFISREKFIGSAMRAMHLINGKFAPYYKWLYRSTADSFPGFAELILHCVEGEDNIREIIDALLSECVKKKIAKEMLPPALMCEEILSLARRVNTADKIAKLEWKLFDKVQNKGGRAFCQDDPRTFFIMRCAQYYTFDERLLDAIYADFLQAASEGRNVITEKYGYMMRYTVPEEFEEIKDALPPVSEEKQRLIDAIVPIQVGWMEEFASKYPDAAAKARVIHSYEDTPDNTSYETYLRGELSTYSDDTVALYGAFIVSLYRDGRNLAEEIISLENGI